MVPLADRDRRAAPGRVVATGRRVLEVGADHARAGHAEEIVHVDIRRSFSLPHPLGQYGIGQRSPATPIQTVCAGGHGGAARLALDPRFERKGCCVEIRPKGDIVVGAVEAQRSTQALQRRGAHLIRRHRSVCTRVDGGHDIVVWRAIGQTAVAVTCARHQGCAVDRAGEWDRRRRAAIDVIAGNIRVRRRRPAQGDSGAARRGSQRRRRGGRDQIGHGEAGYPQGTVGQRAIGVANDRVRRRRACAFIHAPSPE